MKPPLTRRRLVVVAVAQIFPVVLGLTLNYLRPDLVKAMLDSEFGYRIVQFEQVVWLAQGTALVLAARYIVREVVFGLVSTVVFVLLGLPLIAMLLFGPIVNAFLQAPPPQ